MSTFFNSLDKNFKYPTGPIKKEKLATFRIKLPTQFAPSSVQIIFYEYCSDSNFRTIEMDYDFSDNNYIYFKAEFSDLEINIYKYYFSFLSYGSRKYLKKESNSWNAYISDNNSGLDWQLTVYSPIVTHPNMRNGIMYQIFPDRFCKSDNIKNLPLDRTYRKWGELPFFDDNTICTDFFGGNLQGIISKLDYLSSLGVSVIYLNPIWESQSNHRYNTGNYEQVDPVLGNLEDLKELISKAHSLGMILIIDTVLNHIGSDSIYFNKENRYPIEGAFNSPNSPYRNWFNFKENNSYDCWWGFKTLPTFNQNSEEYINYFFGEGGVIDKWYSLGIDGLRLDVADELKNSTLNKISQSSKRNKFFIVIIGEVWENASNKCNYGHKMEYFLGKELTSVMNYPVKEAILAYIRYGNNNDNWAQVLKNTLIAIFIEEYPKEIAYSVMNFLSSHDTVRALTKLAGKEVDNHNKVWQFENDTLSESELLLGKKLLKLSYLLIYFLPGIPSIFYGDEIGMYGMKDPFCRKCFNWNNMDNSLVEFFQELGSIRKKYSNFLATANFEVIEIDNDKCIFSRELNGSTLYIFINRVNYAVDISKFTSNFNNINLIYSIYENSNLYSLLPYNGIIIEVKNVKEVE